jgi:inosine-uridine nucleoside N-ribohydrolase
MTDKQAKRLRRLINRVVKAEIAKSWEGTQDPLDRHAIDVEARLGKSALDLYIWQLSHPTT